MALVYLSSTLLDLKAEREAVSNWLGKADHRVKHSYVADDETVRDSCLDDIEGCDLYVLMLGYRYGFIPKTDNPEGLSITHLEFRQAGKLGVPRIALLRTSVPDTSLTDLDDPERYRKVLAFRAEVAGGDQVRPAQFDDEAALIAELSAAVQRVLAKRQVQALPPPRLRLPHHAFVGRASLVKAVLEGLQRGSREFAFVYLAGVGKTAIAAELIHNEAVNERFPDGVLWAHLGPDPDVRLQLRKWASALGYSDEQLENRSDLEDLADLVAKAIGQRRLLLVVDDVWNTKAGLKFKLGGKNCAFVVTTRNRTVANELMPTVDAVISVPKLSIDDGLDLLSELAPHAARHAPEMLRQFVRRVDGLPIALVLIGNMLKARGDDQGAIHEVERELFGTDLYSEVKSSDFSEFDEADCISLDAVIEASYQALGKATSLKPGKCSGEDLHRALEALSVLRPDPSWFPARLAARIMDAPEPALAELADAGLIEKVRYPGDDEWNRGDPRYTMHRVVAEYLRLKKLTPERSQALNRQAADYYLEQLSELETAYQEGAATTYSYMYRYENPEWQDCQDNWLYHFTQTGYDSEASQSFLKVWFDGFWWWSCFTDKGFDFCDQLLLEWEHRLTLSAAGAAAVPAFSASSRRIERRVQGLDLLRRFKYAYPKETEDRHSGSWSEVTSTLRTLRDLGSLEGDIAQLTQPSARHVRALTDIFLAEAERFGNGDIAAAEAYYRDAQTLLRLDHDDWNVAWSLYHLADMLTENGRYGETPSLCEEALALGRAGGDHEIVALTYRVLGDAALAGHDAEAALCDYRLALEFAYRFQVEPCDPDDYTVQFYADMARSLAQRLLRVRAGDPDPSPALARGLRSVWTGIGVDLPAPASEDALLADADAETLAARLFPPTLKPERRKEEGAAYAKTVRAHLAAIGG